jgi:Protein of unknown function (DUF2795)
MAQSETRVSPAQLAHYLRGVELPASKRDLKADARRNQALRGILNFIDKLPEEQYRTMAEVMKAVGEIE